MRDPRIRAFLLAATPEFLADPPETADAIWWQAQMNQKRRERERALRAIFLVRTCAWLSLPAIAAASALWVGMHTGKFWLSTGAMLVVALMAGAQFWNANRQR